MQIELIFEGNNVPLADFLGKFTLRRVKLVGMPSLTGRQHLDRETSCSCIAEVDAPLASHGRKEMDRESTVSIFLTNGPGPVPVLMPDKMRDPIHTDTVAKLNRCGNTIAPLSPPVPRPAQPASAGGMMEKRIYVMPGDNGDVTLRTAATAPTDRPRHHSRHGGAGTITPQKETGHMHIATLTELLRDLNDLPAAEHIARLRAKVIENGGTWTDAMPSGSHLYEMSLYGIVGRGMDQHATCADWMRAAQDMIDNATPPEIHKPLRTAPRTPAPN